MNIFKKIKKWLTSIYKTGGANYVPKPPPDPLNFEVIRKLFQNRLQRYSLCARVNPIEQKQLEGMVTHEETVLGSKEKVIELGQRFTLFENDEVFLQDSLTYFYIYKKMQVKDKYSFEEVVNIVKEAMGERNDFMRECESQVNDELKRVMIPET